MENFSLVAKVTLFLRQNAGKSFTAREIAVELLRLYPEYFQRKKENSQQVFTSESQFVTQIVAEIGARKKQLMQQDYAVQIQDKPRPRMYRYENGKDGGHEKKTSGLDVVNPEIDEDYDQVCVSREHHYSEVDLYPLLMTYLRQEHQLFSKRINKKCSKKDKGKNANHWLHPDIVSMQPITEGFHASVKDCVQAGGGRMAYLWSFEVKKQITRASVRQYFFQAVSNSSWANYGYLVCSGIADDGCMDELRMLSGLHGIGVIVLKVDNIMESEVMIPALFRSEVDWCSVNRLVEENKDMKLFIQDVTVYYKSGLVRGF